MQRLMMLFLFLATALVLSGCGEHGVYSATLITDGRHTIAAGETLSGEMLIAAGEVILEAGARVSGSVYVLGGTLAADGVITGDLAMVGGTVTLGPRARVGGNLNLGGGEISRSQAATVGGQLQTGGGVRAPFFPAWTIFPTWAAPSPVEQIATGAIRSLMLALLAFLSVRFRPQPVTRIAQAIVGWPVVTGALGLLTMVVGVSLLVFMAFTMVLIPVALLGAVGMGIAIICGWIALGRLLGRRIARTLQWALRPPREAALGMLLFAIGMEMIGAVPVAGAIILMVLAGTGLGAVLLTRGGTRWYVPAPTAAPPSESVQQLPT
jgi:hypothetical protein